MFAHRPSLRGVLFETSRIIGVHSRHFLALSVLFIFPASFASIIYNLTLQPTAFNSQYRRFLSNVSTPDSDQVHPVEKSQLLIEVLYVLLRLLFYLCAVPSITYTTFRGFYGSPTKFVSMLKSIMVSFLPLLATEVVAVIIRVFIVFACGISMVLSYMGLTLLGFEINYYSENFLVSSGILIAALAVGVMIYLKIEWYLMTVSVVLESQWGVAPLKRSSYLVKGTRGVVFLIILFFEILSVLLSMWYSSLMANSCRINEGWTGWWVVLLMGVYAGLRTILSLYSLVAKTVVFVYCKALHGELAIQNDEKFNGVYVHLLSEEVV